MNYGLKFESRIKNQQAINNTRNQTMTPHAIIIFVRRPILGKVKTRLAKSLGADKALAIYKTLLAHTVGITIKLSADKFVYYADEIEEQDGWNNEVYQKRKQVEGELGHKMQAAFEDCFKEGYNRVLIIGSDCYELTTEIVEKAFSQLEDADLVAGPAKDGGYYLLGMKQPNPTIFDLEAWSNADVLKSTLMRCKGAGLSYYLLPTLNDVDEAEDVNFDY